jgi:hypothetical protein
LFDGAEAQVYQPAFVDAVGAEEAALRSEFVSGLALGANFNGEGRGKLGAEPLTSRVIANIGQAVIGFGKFRANFGPDAPAVVVAIRTESNDELAGEDPEFFIAHGLLDHHPIDVLERRLLIRKRKVVLFAHSASVIQGRYDRAGRLSGDHHAASIRAHESSQPLRSRRGIMTVKELHA